MPSAVLRHLSSPNPLQGLIYPPSYRPDEVLISPNSECACGHELTGMGASNWASATYPSANRALGFMFSLTDYFLVQKVWWMNGTTATTDAADVAVYSEDGATRIVAGGSTNIATANVVQEKDCTDTVLPPGRYWCVYNQNGVTATPIMCAIALGLARAAGWAQFAGAVALGATFTPAAIAAANVPYFGIAARTQVA